MGEFRRALLTPRHDRKKKYIKKKYRESNENVRPDCHIDKLLHIVTKMCKCFYLSHLEIVKGYDSDMIVSVIAAN